MSMVNIEKKLVIIFFSNKKKPTDQNRIYSEQ